MGFPQNKNREGSHDRRPDAETVRNHLPRTVYKIFQRTTTCRNCIRHRLTDEPRPPPRQRPGPLPRPLSSPLEPPFCHPHPPPIRPPEDRTVRRPISPTATRHRPAIAAAADKASRSFYHAPMNSSRLSARTPAVPTLARRPLSTRLALALGLLALADAAPSSHRPPRPSTLPTPRPRPPRTPRRHTAPPSRANRLQTTARPPTT